MKNIFEEPIEQLELKIPLKLNSHPKKNKGIMHFRFADCSTYVKDKDGKEVGAIEGCLGGGIDISYKDVSYYLGAKEIWNAFLETIGETENKIK